MAVNTLNQLLTLLDLADQDVTILGAISNDSATATGSGNGPGLVTTRNGDNVKNVQKVIADINNGITTGIRTEIQYDGVTLLDHAAALNFNGNSMTVQDIGGVATITINSEITVAGTPVTNQIGIWTDGVTLEGNAGLTWDGSELTVTGTVNGRDIAVDGTALDNIVASALISADNLSDLDNLATAKTNLGIDVAEASVASATTADLGAETADNVLITGTTPIISFGPAAAGITRKGRFTDALTLTYNAVSLILPGLTDITTSANSTFEALSLGGGNWIVTKYQKANGLGLDSWLLTSANYTASTGEKIAANMSGSAWTLTLPASPSAGSYVHLILIEGDASINNLTVNGNGNTVQGDATLIVDVNTLPLALSFIYNLTEWNII
jgi:hypothetical protein